MQVACRYIYHKLVMPGRHAQKQITLIALFLLIVSRVKIVIYNNFPILGARCFPPS